MPFNTNPFEILHPDTRWVPFQEEWEKHRDGIKKFEDVVELFKMV